MHRVNRLITLFSTNKLIRQPNVQAVVVLLGLLTAFFYLPIIHLGNYIYSPVDIAQTTALTQTSPGVRPLNPLLADVEVQFIPWELYDRSVFRSGQFPLWDPYNANGVPLLANYQSAVLSIYSLPFYVLPLKWAVLITAYAKLFLIGFFTFLFLKLLGLKQLAALLGGVAFMFSGFNIIWLSYPHVATTTCLPMAMCCVEWGVRRYQHNRSTPDHRRSLIWPLVGFVISLVIGMLAGHPETIYFCCILIGVYFLFRVITLWQADRFHWNKIPARLVLLFGGMTLLAVGIAAIQLLPFAEYLTHSDTTFSQNRQLILNTDLWPLKIYPDLLGSPSDPLSLDSDPWYSFLARYYNYYNESNGNYVGEIVLYLVVLAVLFAPWNPKRRYIAFFVVLAVILVVYTYGLFGLTPIFNVIPMIKSAVPSRSFQILDFVLSVSAAFGLDYLLSIEFRPTLPAEIPPLLRRLQTLLKSPRRSRLAAALITLLPGVVMAFVALEGALLILQNVIAVHEAEMPTASVDTVAVRLAHLLTHLQGITIVFGLALIITGLLWLIDSRVWRTLLSIALVGLTFLQTGFVLRSYNPTVSDQALYPVTPETHQFLQYAAGKSPFVLGSGVIVPDANLAYGFSMPASYDVLGVKQYMIFLNKFFKTISGVGMVYQVNETGFKLMGADTIVTNRYDTANNTVLAGSPAYTPIIPSGPADAASSTFNVYRYNNSVPVYHTVTNTRLAATDDQALAMIQQSGFDPTSTVILTADGSNAPTASTDQPPSVVPPTPVQVISEAAADIKLSVTGYPQDGYLVMAKALYPGWKAKVNGVDQPVYRANYAFSAIALHKGDNTVEFYYDPDSFKFGVLISVFSVFILAVLIGLGVWQSGKGSGLAAA